MGIPRRWVSRVGLTRAGVAYCRVPSRIEPGDHMALSLQTVKTEVLGQHVFHIRMNRPERLNAIGAQISYDLKRAWYEFESNPDLRVAVLSGEGRIFSAGRDIREQAEAGLGGTQAQEDGGPVSQL